ncbi:EAL domain-containing protein [Acinetobacter baumannii]|uniref:EAL domain-containing protein n=1 Tax=Acinetobacter baumannii TaxID=470 RepID=UPI0003024C86
MRAIISLGNSINTPLIAEGVETAGQLQILEEEGCDEMQGFLFGEPVDIKHLPDRR